MCNDFGGLTLGMSNKVQEKGSTFYTDVRLKIVASLADNNVSMLVECSTSCNRKTLRSSPSFNRMSFIMRSRSTKATVCSLLGAMGSLFLGSTFKLDV